MENATSIRLPVSSLPTCFLLRHNSAFSLYEIGQEDEDEPEVKVNEESNLSSNSSQVQSRRVWKREKKDKRELNRLETKNLNRYFRSKINELLRDVKENPKNKEEQEKAEEILDLLNRSNKIMFSEIRDIIKDEWLQKKLTTCSAGLLKYIHGGKMGMQSKLIMLKYFNKILKAIRNPDNFTCWK